MTDTTARYTTKSGKTFIVYHTNWSMYGRKFQVKDLPIDYMPDLAYAFVNLVQGPAGWEIVSGDKDADSEKRIMGADGLDPPDSWNGDPAPYYGNIGQFMKLKKAGKKFNMQLSIGGWTWSKNFSTAVATPADRTSLVASLIVWFKKFPVFNGVSLDWEYLSSDGVNYGNGGNVTSKDDPQNFAEFLKLLRAQLNANGMNHYHISFCVTPAPEKAVFPIDLIVPLIDELHVMTYDFTSAGMGDTMTAHQTNLFDSPHGKWSVDKAVKFYMGKGVPSKKIFIGAVLYSRTFAGTDGLGKAAPAGPGSVEAGQLEQGISDYKVLPYAGATEEFDDVAKAGYSYDPAKKAFHSYDTVKSVEAKCKYVMDNDLAGIIVWESSGDVPINNPRSLIATLYKGLNIGNLTISATASASRPTPPVEARDGAFPPAPYSVIANSNPFVAAVASSAAAATTPSAEGKAAYTLSTSKPEFWIIVGVVSAVIFFLILALIVRKK